MEDDSKRLETLLRHIDNVQKNCLRLGQSLIEKNEVELGRELIANGMIHDNSKFYGIEWQYLHGDVKESKPELFKIAAEQHITTNSHHPEYWRGIKNMPLIFVAEMTADWYARSMEFGDNIWDWAKDKAASKYQYSTKSRVYKDIKKYLELMLEPAFG